MMLAAQLARQRSAAIAGKVPGGMVLEAETVRSGEVNHENTRIACIGM